MDLHGFYWWIDGDKGENVSVDYKASERQRDKYDVGEKLIKKHFTIIITIR